MNGSDIEVALFDEDVYKLFKIRPSPQTPYTDVTYRKGKPRKTVRRPMNSFMAFSFFERKKICLENPKIHNAEVSRKLGSQWKQTNSGQKRLFEKIANILKIYHAIEFPDYKYKPKKKPKRLTSATPALLKKSGRKRPKKLLPCKIAKSCSDTSSDDHNYECSSNSDHDNCDSIVDQTTVLALPQQEIVPTDSLLTPPISAPMTPESLVDSTNHPMPQLADNFPEALVSALSVSAQENLAISEDSQLCDMLLQFDADSNFMNMYESEENSASSLSFSSSPAEFTPYTENQLMDSDLFSYDDLLQ